MIRGTVRSLEVRIKLNIRGPRARQRQIEAVIDTGFTVGLTLPRTLIAALKLRWHSFERGTLVDGSESLFDLYEATITWDRTAKRILVAESETDPLVGMALLDGYELNMRIREGGTVTIRRLNPRTS
jgi:clan AA aspartic protease